MKKILLACGLFFATTAVFGQYGFHLGFYGMPQNTWILNDKDLETSRSGFQYETTWGWAGMASLGFNFGDPMGIHIAALYSKQGQINTSVDSSGARITTERELRYLKIPLLIHINSDPAPVMLNLEFGPQLGLLMDATHLVNDQVQTLSFETNRFYKPKDIGIAWALGAEFALTDWFHLVLQHRGDYSLFDIEDKEFLIGQSAVDPDRDKSNSANFGITGGFKFCFMPRGGGKRVKFWIR